MVGTYVISYRFVYSQCLNWKIRRGNIWLSKKLASPKIIKYTYILTILWGNLRNSRCMLQKEKNSRGTPFPCIPPKSSTVYTVYSINTNIPTYLIVIIISIIV